MPMLLAPRAPKPVHAACNAEAEIRQALIHARIKRDQAAAHVQQLERALAMVRK